MFSLGKIIQKPHSLFAVIQFFQFFSVIIQEEKNKALADKYCVPLSSVFWLKDKLPYRLNHIKKSLTYQNWFRDSSILKAGLLSSAY